MVDAVRLELVRLAEEDETVTRAVEREVAAVTSPQLYAAS
jgi:hypothetical protein